MFLIFDTETTGLPRNYNAPISDTDNWPRVVQIAWQLHDELGNLFATPTMFLLDNKREILLRPNSVKQMDSWVHWFLIRGNR